MRTSNPQRRRYLSHPYQPIASNPQRCQVCYRMRHHSQHRPPYQMQPPAPPSAAAYDWTTEEAQSKIRAAYCWERDKINGDNYRPDEVFPLALDLYKLFARVDAYLHVRNQLLNADLATPTGEIEPNRALWTKLWRETLKGLTI